MAEHQTEQIEASTKSSASQREQGGSTASASELSRAASLPHALAGAARSPFSMMRRMMEDMDRMFEDFGFGTAFSSIFRNQPLARQLHGNGQPLWSPQIEVQQREGQLVVRADLTDPEEEEGHRREQAVARVNPIVEAG